LLTVLATSPRVPPGLLSWPAWQALRAADVVLAPAGHPQLPALDEAEIRYRIVDEAQVESLTADGVVIGLPEPGTAPPVPPGAQPLKGSADLPGAHLIDLVATMDWLRVECPWDARQTYQSLAPHMLEEPYEALEALECGDEQAFCEELGDARADQIPVRVRDPRHSQPGQPGQLRPVPTLSSGARANCWSLAESAGHEGWGRMQALLGSYR
jgi:XTP/dITP diphosphohydrolase